MISRIPGVLRISRRNGGKRVVESGWGAAVCLKILLDRTQVIPVIARGLLTRWSSALLRRRSVTGMTATIWGTHGSTRTWWSWRAHGARCVRRAVWTRGTGGTRLITICRVLRSKIGWVVTSAVHVPLGIGCGPRRRRGGVLPHRRRALRRRRVCHGAGSRRQSDRSSRVERVKPKSKSEVGDGRFANDFANGLGRMQGGPR